MNVFVSALLWLAVPPAPLSPSPSPVAAPVAPDRTAPVPRGAQAPAAGAAASPAAAPATRGPLRPTWGGKFDRKRDYDLQHLRFEIDFDLDARAITGVATNTIAAIAPRLEEARFDAEGLTIDKVLVGGAAAKFRAEKTELRVALPAALAAGARTDVEIRYHGKPQSGLHWVGPEHGYRDKPREVWSQGEDMNNHFWIPTWDYPNDKTSWEAVLTVPEDLVAVSNGVLVSEKKGPRPATRTFHYRMAEPNVTYLIAVAVGPWERFADDWRGKPVEYFVPRGTGEAMARRSFGKTPAMIDFFSKRIGVDYPWPKYAQVTVAEFVVGGMENVSCTLQTDRTLHDERDHLDRDSDGLVAHELAHQWWGDLLTTRDWPNMWLNEGFATYFAALWTEADEGRDEFRLDMRRSQAGFRSADPPADPRPIVESFWSQPDGRTSNHVYTKGSSVLHMLRFVLGDDTFWKGIRLYAKRHAGGSVDSEDLRRAMAEASGDPLHWFFDEWVYAAGYPQLEIATRWDARTATETMAVKQAQKTGGLVPLFRMPVDVKLWVGGKPRVERVWISGADETFTWKLPARPDFVHFDDGGWLLKTVKHDKSLDELRAQLEKDDDPVARVEAIEALGEMAGDDGAAQTVAKAAGNPKLARRVRTAATRALASWPRSAAARAGALRLLSDKEAHIRASAAGALAAFEGDAAVAAALGKALAGDRSPATQSAAVRSLGRVLGKQGWHEVAKGLGVASFRDSVKAATIDVLARLDGERALPLLLDEARYGRPYDTRMTAMSALGDLAPELDAASRKQIAGVLAEGAQRDRWYRARQSAMRNLAAVGGTDARTALERIAKEDDGEAYRKAAKENLDRMAKQDHAAEETRRLKARVQELEDRLKKRGPAGSAPAQATPAAAIPASAGAAGTSQF